MTGDEAQRRLAERLIVRVLRRFHREQPLAPGLRVDALASRVRSAAAARPAARHRGGAPLELGDAALRHVIDDLAASGALQRAGRRVRLPDADVGLDAEMAGRVESLMTGLRASGASPPRVDGVAARLGIPPPILDQLRAAGRLRHVAPGIDYPSDVWVALRARVDDMSGTVTVARLRDELRTSRRHAEAILAAVGARPRAARARPRSAPRRRA